MSSLRDKVFSRGDTTLRRGLMGNLVTLVLVVAGLVGGLLLWGSHRAIDDMSRTSIQQAVERTEANLAGYFRPVEMNLAILEDWGRAGQLELDLENLAPVNARLKPMLRRMEQVSAVALEDADGRQYYFWQHGENWWGMYRDSADSDERVSLRWDDDGRLLDRRTEPIGEQLQRPWYDGAMAIDEGRTYWTEPFVLFTRDEPGVAAARRFESPDDGQIRVVAVAVTIADLSGLTSAMRPSENGYSAVLTPTGEVVGLPRASRYEDPAVVEDEILSSWADLDLEGLGSAWEVWRDSGADGGIVEADCDRWGGVHAGFSRFTLGEQNLVVATVIPQEDLTGTVNQQRNLAAGVGLVGVVLAVLLSIWMSRRYRKRISAAYDDARQLGQYRLTEKIGGGGMGDVYRADHAMLERPTAVKLLKAEMYDRESIRRFEREVQLTCRLTHPNTITVFDYGETDEGLFYYAMEYLDGVTLKEFLDYIGPLPESRVIYLMCQVCGALIEAHQIGLIHRDIKPGNIMITDEGGMADRVTVLDFGLVKDVKAPREISLTNQDYRQGSPGYMAPEVIREGKGDEPAVDIFAVGAVMYTLLCGKNPYRGESAVDTMIAQIEQPLQPPSELLGRQVDADLEELIMACMARERSQRPASMRDVLTALMNCESSGQWTLDDALEWWREHRDDALARRKPPETFEGTEAFEMTVTMGDQEVSTTLEGEPEEVV